MIFGIGTDVVQLARVEETYARHGEHFVRRLLMPEEEAAFRKYKRPVRFLAMRFAAKEAAVKALGTGFAEGIGPRDVAVRSLPSGKPELVLSGKAREKADALGVKKLHLTLTHTRDNAAAVVILEG